MDSFFKKSKATKNKSGKNNLSSRQATTVRCLHAKQTPLLPEAADVFSSRTIEAEAGISRIQIKPRLSSEFKVSRIGGLSKEYDKVIPSPLLFRKESWTQIRSKTQMQY